MPTLCPHPDAAPPDAPAPAWPAASGSRYAPPRTLHPLLPRPHLAQLLAPGMGRITVLCAPPGSGKTTTLAQHYEQLAAQHAAGTHTGAPSPLRWLSLGVQDNDPAVLRQHLARALLPGADTLADDALLPAQLHTFVDGLEHLHDPHAQAIAWQLLLSVPATTSVYTTLVHAQQPQLQQAHLRGLACIVPPQALHFIPPEAAQLLGPHWPPEHAQLLCERLQGWAAGLRLLQPHPQAARAWLLDRSAQCLLPAPLADYVETLLHTTLSPTQLQHLMTLGTLERFRSELLAALPAPTAPDAPAACTWADVAPLLRSGWLLQPQPEAPAWVQVHPAWGPHLRQRLQRHDPARYEQLRHFAAAWHAAHGFATEAVRHAAQLPSAQQAQHIVEQVGAIAVDLGEGPDVQLPPVPPERAGELPLVFLAQVYQHFRQGQVATARQLLEAACAHTQHFARIHKPQLHEEVRGWHRLLHTVLLTTEDGPIAPDDFAALEREYHAQAGRNPVLAASLASVMAFIWLAEGRYREAATICSMGLQLNTAARHAKARLFLHLHHASAAMAQGTMAQAQRHVCEAQRLARQECGPHSYEMHTLQLLQALVYWERNDLASAQQLLQPALQHMGAVYGWTHLYADVFAMACELVCLAPGSQGDANAAEPLLQQATQLAQQRQLPRLQQMLRVIRLRTLTLSRCWAPAQTLLQSDEFAALVQPCTEPAQQALWQHSVQVPALLAAATLELELGRARAAEQWLQQLPAQWQPANDQRLHWQCCVLRMRIAHSLRRYKLAAEHWHHAIELARLGGLHYRVWRERQHLQHTLAVLLRTRSAAPSHASQQWLQQVLQAHAVQATAHPPAAARPALAPAARAPHAPHRLSPRESEILTLIAQGCINKEIAAQLGISEGTVKTHRKHIHEKLGVRSRSQALQKAREWLLL